MRRVLLLTLAALLLILAAPAAAAPPGVAGEWVSLPPVPANFNAVHLIASPTGKVLLIAGSGRDKANFAAGTFKSFVWEPGAAQPWRRIDTPDDLFCGGHVLLPDGRALVVGGTSSYGPPFRGANFLYRFDFATERYERLTPMQVARWYPTVVTLKDGRIVIATGRDGQAHTNDLNELYDPATGTHSPLPGRRLFPLYADLRLVAAGPNAGKLFYSGSSFDRSVLPPGFWEPLANTFQTTAPPPQASKRARSASCWMGDVRDGNLMIMGGDTTAGTAVVNVNSPTPTWRTAAPLREPKQYHNCVNLPDGRVLEAGGGRSNTVAAASHEVATIAGPTAQWVPAAPLPQGEHRVYHSLLCVLDSGAVLSVTSNPGTETTPQSRSMLLYRPSYLFKGTRPVITNAPTQVRYGQRIPVTTSGSIDHVQITGYPSVTHQTDPNQRPVRLLVAHGTVRIPVSDTILPPGWYRLWAVDARGVPSRAHAIHVT